MRRTFYTFCVYYRILNGKKGKVLSRNPFRIYYGEIPESTETWCLNYDELLTFAEQDKTGAATLTDYSPFGRKLKDEKGILLNDLSDGWMHFITRKKFRPIAFYAEWKEYGCADNVTVSEAMKWLRPDEFAQYCEDNNLFINCLQNQGLTK